MSASESKAFETYVSISSIRVHWLTTTQVQSQITRLSNRGLKEIEEEVKQWHEELDNLRKLLPSAATIVELRDEVIPGLEKQVVEETGKLEQVQEEVEEVRIPQLVEETVIDSRPNSKCKERRWRSGICRHSSQLLPSSLVHSGKSRTFEPMSVDWSAISRVPDP